MNFHERGIFSGMNSTEQPSDFSLGSHAQTDLG